MDFMTTEAANDLGGLVDTIVDSVCTPEHQRELDGLDQRFDRTLWSKLIDADILSSASAASLGGDGFGVLEQVAILVALGHQMAAVPYLDSVMLAAGALARFGSEELQQSWGVPAVRGEKILTVALEGEMGEGPVRATRASDGYRLTGTRTQAGYGPVADAFLVPAETDSGSAVFLVTADDPGVTVTALRTTGFNSAGHLALDGVAVDNSRRVGDSEVVAWLETLVTLGRSAFQLGVLERGLQMTAEYARTREQFDKIEVSCGTEGRLDRCYRTGKGTGAGPAGGDRRYFPLHECAGAVGAAGVARQPAEIQQQIRSRVGREPGRARPPACRVPHAATSCLRRRLVRSPARSRARAGRADGAGAPRARRLGPSRLLFRASGVGLAGGEPARLRTGVPCRIDYYY